MDAANVISAIVGAVMGGLLVISAGWWRQQLHRHALVRALETEILSIIVLLWQCSEEGRCPYPLTTMNVWRNNTQEFAIVLAPEAYSAAGMLYRGLEQALEVHEKYHTHSCDGVQDEVARGALRTLAAAFHLFSTWGIAPHTEMMSVIKRFIWHLRRGRVSTGPKTG